MKKKTVVTIFAGLFLCAGIVRADTFSLKETVSGNVHGPFENAAGERVQMGDAVWILLSAGPSRIMFSGSVNTEKKTYGPYPFEHNRVINLGSKAYVLQLSAAAGAETLPRARPSTQPLTLDVPETAPAPKPDEPARPQPWELKPLPSTNPADHQTQKSDPIKLENREFPAYAYAWFEPLNRTKYDWEVGEYAGSRGSDLEMTRIGARGAWRNFFVEFGYAFGGETAGDIVPDGAALADLNLDEGSGFGVSAEYMYAFVIDGGWSAFFGGSLIYAKISYDMNATALTKNDVILPPEEYFAEAWAAEAENEGPNYSYKHFTSSVDMTEISLSLFGGVDYSEEYWGVSASLIVDAWTDTDFSGALEIAGETYKLSVDRTHPVSILAEAWYSPYEDYLVTGSVSLGGETMIRIGVGKFFF